ncbi:sulfotransferase [Flavimaricola marinus]|uniref:Sulfotransferase domain protein n=1 Tax=Flavimaricola marinus TaxID=1819565 RepID=A0A238LDT7_9RHOB|nr:sulfotransferase [Flavimaricola marinus]SMY07781.1 Sulfotransferase domain protein [Flavimaricola marinus]
MPAAVDPRFAKPDCLFYVIGAQKSGTSWLHDYFLGHPGIHVTAWKEADYWNTVRPPFDVNTRLPGALAEQEKVPRLLRPLLPPLIKRRHANQRAVRDVARGADTGAHTGYADLLFEHYKGQPALGEVNPQYARLGAETFAEMAAMASNVRFVLIMRDPVSRVLSRLRQTAERAGRDPVQMLTEAVTEGAESDLVLRSRYDLVLDALNQAVAPEQVACFFYETLFQQSELDRLTDFLGAASRKGWTGRKVFASKGASFDVPPQVDRDLMALLAPTYAAIRARFGDRVPAKWRSTSGLVDA